MGRLVTRAEFARLAKVSKAAVGKACQASLAPACVGDRIDSDHSAATAYLERRGIRLSPAQTRDNTRIHTVAPDDAAPSKRGARRAIGDSEAGEANAPEVPQASLDEIEGYAELLRPIADRFGTRRNFRDWVLALKEIEVVREKFLANEETQDSLISRDFVASHVFGVLKSMTQRILRDAPKTIVRRIYSAAKAGASMEDSEAFVREILSSQITPVKTKISRLLKEKHENELAAEL